MRESTAVAIIIASVATLMAMLIVALYFYETDKQTKKYELRKIYVEKCQMTPAQAEKLIPEDK